MSMQKPRKAHKSEECLPVAEDEAVVRVWIENILIRFHSTNEDLSWSEPDLEVNPSSQLFRVQQIWA